MAAAKAKPKAKSKPKPQPELFYFQWNGPVPGKVHLAYNRLTTICDRDIPDRAIQFEKLPKDLAQVCKHCQQIEAEQARYRL